MVAGYPSDVTQLALLFTVMSTPAMSSLVAGLLVVAGTVGWFWSTIHDTYMTRWLERTIPSPGDEIVIMPAGKIAKIRSVESWPLTPVVGRQGAGSSVGITLDRELFIERGDVIAHAGSSPRDTRRIRARVRVALGEGLRTLRQDGIDKVWSGATTIEEPSDAMVQRGNKQQPNKSDSKRNGCRGGGGGGDNDGGETKQQSNKSGSERNGGCGGGGNGNGGDVGNGVDN